jgi:hypothetical protein
MKKILWTLIGLILIIKVFAQAPQSFQYQAVIRDATGNVLQSQSVNLRLSIIPISAVGVAEYVETHLSTTNTFGIVSLSVGNGTVVTGNFSTINWGASSHYIKVEADPTGGTSYLDMGTTQLLSVPYAINSLSATQADNATNANYATVAGTANYVGGTGIDITGSTVVNTAPDQTLILNQGGSTTVTGNYPNFTISSADNNTTYSAGSGLSLSGTTFDNTAPDQTVTLTQGGATTISGTYPNFTISSVDNNTTYSAGSGLSLSGTTFENTAPDQAVTLTQGGATTISGTYPNFTISSTDLNSGTPGGLNKTIQYNNSGVFGGNANFIWDNSNERLGIGTASPLGRVVVQGSATALATEPLFEVKNKAGQTVFVVYEDSVNVFVNDDAIQSNRGGFAVSGRNNTKALTHNYLKVTPDKTRIFLNEDVASDGFAVIGINSGGNKDYLNVSVDTMEVINPSQPRILWYPTKEAFLTGRVFIENRDSVGINSFASGFESKAIGRQSQALGYKAISRGNYSTAIGKNAVAKSINSFAFGDHSIAANQDAYSFGAYAEATGIGSFAFGYVGRDSLGPTGVVTRASGNYSFAFGLGSQASAEGAIAFGAGDSATGLYSLSMGYKNKSTDWYSTSMGAYTRSTGFVATSMGYRTIASGYFSTALGFGSIASGQNSFAMGYETMSNGFFTTAMGWQSVASGECGLSTGYQTEANGSYSVAMGFRTKANAQSSTAFGDGSIANGIWSTAMGVNTIANGMFSTALGSSTHSRGVSSIAMGQSTYANSYNSFVAGRYNDTTSSSASSWIGTDPLFVIGNGSGNLSRSNALTVLKNGFVGIGTIAPPARLSVVSVGSNPSIPNTTSTGILRIGISSSEGLDIGKMASGSFAAWLQSGLAGIIADPLSLQPSGGNVGIGTTTPVYQLQLSTDNAAKPSTNTWTIASDERLKKDITTFNDGLDVLLKINPVKYKYNGLAGMPTDGENIGILAQEIQKIAPYTVGVFKYSVGNLGDRNGAKNETEYLSFNSHALTFVTINAIKELKKLNDMQVEKNEILVKENTEQKILINNLIERIEKLESKIK